MSLVVERRTVPRDPPPAIAALSRPDPKGVYALALVSNAYVALGYFSPNGPYTTMSRFADGDDSLFYLENEEVVSVPGDQVAYAMLFSSAEDADRASGIGRALAVECKCPFVDVIPYRIPVHSE